MTFEHFVREFADWFSQQRPAAMLIGIRADESYNRFVAIATEHKKRFADDKPRTTLAPEVTHSTFTRFMTGKQPISGHGMQKPNRSVILCTM